MFAEEGRDSAPKCPQRLGPCQALCFCESSALSYICFPFKMTLTGLCDLAFLFFFLTDRGDGGVLEEEKALIL